LPVLPWLMLNPSVADATKDDRTLSKCIKITQYNGFGGLGVFNIFAYRSTNPKILKSIANPEGKRNDYYLSKLAIHQPLVLAYGNQAENINPIRLKHVLRQMVALQTTFFCLGTTDAGHPKHPLYLAAYSQLLPYEPII